MSFIQLGDRTIQMDAWEYLSMKDSELQDLIGFESGYIVNNPHTDSCLGDLVKNKQFRQEEELEEEEEEDNELYSGDDIQDFLSSDSFSGDAYD